LDDGHKLVVHGGSLPWLFYCTIVGLEEERTPSLGFAMLRILDYCVVLSWIMILAREAGGVHGALSLLQFYVSALHTISRWLGLEMKSARLVFAA
jgi:hypothetical protein